MEFRVQEVSLMLYETNLQGSSSPHYAVDTAIMTLFVLKVPRKTGSDRSGRLRGFEFGFGVAKWTAGRA